jgi:hypothetical protein
VLRCERCAKKAKREKELSDAENLNETV